MSQSWVQGQQNPQLKVFRRSHRPIFQPRDTSQSQSSIQYVQTASTPLADIHIQCINECQLLQKQASYLQHTLDQLVTNKQPLEAKLQGLANKIQPQEMHLSNQRELLARLKTQSTVLKEKLKAKLMAEAKAQENTRADPEEKAKEKARELDIKQDKLDEEIKLLKKSIAEGEERLKTYQLKINPSEVTELQRQNDLLKKQVLAVSCQAGRDAAQFTTKDYTGLKSTNQLLIQKVLEKTTYLQQLQKRVEGLNSQEMFLERANQQMQFEMARIEPTASQDEDYYYRHRLLEQKYQVLEVEYMRLQAMVRAGSNIDAEMRAYSWALANQTQGLQALPFQKSSLISPIPYF